MAEEKRKREAFTNAKHNSGLYKTYEWRKFRQGILDAHPFCSVCGARDVPLQVHHITPARDNMDLFLDPQNMMVLCQSCHAAETQREIAQRRRNR